MRALLFLVVFFLYPQIGIGEDWIIKNEYHYKFSFKGKFIVHGKDFNEKDEALRKIERLYLSLDEDDKLVSIPFTWLSKEQTKKVKILGRTGKLNTKEKVKLLHELSEKAEKVEIPINKLIESYHESILPKKIKTHNEQIIYAFVNNVLSNISSESKKATYIQAATLMKAFVFDYARSGKYGFKFNSEEYELPVEKIQYIQQVLTSEWGNQIIYVQGEKPETYREIWKKMSITFE